MKNYLVKTFLLGTYVLLHSCVPTAYYLTIDKNVNDQTILLNRDKIGIIEYVSNDFNTTDTALMNKVAQGVRDKIKEDRQIEKGIDSIFILTYIEGKDALPQIKSTNTTAQLEGISTAIIIENLRFADLKTLNVQEKFTEDYSTTTVFIPYSIDFKVYDNYLKEFVYGSQTADTASLELLNSNYNKYKIAEITKSKLPDISYRIGTNLAAQLSPQWETESRMLITYVEQQKWLDACDLAQEFKLKEAIGIWMPFTYSNNRKKAAYAAYNIATLCQIMGDKELAKKWINFSLMKYKFKEAVSLYNFISNSN